MAENAKPSVLDRVLRLFTVVKAGEGYTAVLLALNVFIILTAYYILKPVRDALILAEGSAELRSYVSAAQIGVLAVAVPLYGVLASRLPRRRLINNVTAFFVLCLVAFYLLAQLDVPLGVVFFIWVGIFNVMLIAQFWSFANDIYTREEGERLFPIAAFGAALGAVLGAAIARTFIEPLGVYQLMLLAGGFLVVAVLISNHIDSRERHRRELSGYDISLIESVPAVSGEVRIDKRKIKHAIETGDMSVLDEEEAETGLSAFQLVFRCRYLLLIAFLILFLNWVNTTGEYILASILEDAAAAAMPGGLTERAAEDFVKDYTGSFYAGYYGLINLLELVIQLFVVSRIIKYIGIRWAILSLPIISLGGYAILAFMPILPIARWVKTAENATDYSLYNTVRHSLFLPTTREQKYKAKQVIDSFFWRAGDVSSALLVFVGTTFFAWQVTGFAVFNIALAIGFLTIAFFIGREYKKLVDTGKPPCVSVKSQEAKPDSPMVGSVN